MKPHLRFPEYENPICKFELQEVASYRRGSFPQPYGLKKWYDDEAGFPFIQVFDVGDDFRLKPFTKRRISELAKAQSVLVPKGSIVLTIQGSIGRIAITQYDACCDRTLLIFREYKRPVITRYFAYALFLLFEVEKRSAPGGTIKTITKERLNSFELPLPRIEEQQKIADFLTSVDTRIQQLKQKQSLLQQYKKGLMQKLFSQVLRFKDDNGNSFPDWVSHTLGDIGDTYSGLSGKSGEDFGQGQDFITYKQIFDRSEIDVSKCGKVHVEPGERQNLVQTGDVLFTTSSETRAEVGFASVLLEEGFTCFLNSFCFGYRADSQVLSPIFSRYLFHSQDARKRISILGQGSTRFNMSKTAFMKTKFYLPCLAEQEKIANALAAMDQKIDLVAKQIEHTQTFKKGLLQQMFV